MLHTHHDRTTLPCGTGTGIYLHLQKVCPAGMALSSATSPASRCKTPPSPKDLSCD